MSRKKINIVNLFSERLRILIKEELDITQADFAKNIGTSEGYISGILNQGKGPSADIIAGIYLKHREYLDWLLTGEGPMRREERGATLAVHEPPAIYTCTAEKYADVFSQVRDILESEDDFVIKALRERLNDYRISVAMNRERRGINQRLARVEEMLGKMAKGEKQLGEVKPVGTQASPARDTAKDGSNAKEKAI